MWPVLWISYVSLCTSRNVALKLLAQDPFYGALQLCHVSRTKGPCKGFACSKDVMMGWDSDTTGAALGSLVASTQIFVGKSFRLRGTTDSLPKMVKKASAIQV